MARADLLNRAYQAVAALRAKGRTKLSVEEVAECAGLARSTFYLKDDDWQEVREVIRGKPSPRVRLAAVEVTAASKADLRLTALARRVEEAEAELERIRAAADDVYRKLIDQVQYYFALASETPKKREQQAKLLKEVARAKQEVQRLKAENSRLQASQNAGAEIASLAVAKRVVGLPDAAPSVSALYAAFLDKMAGIVPDEPAGRAVGAVYLLSGLPLSGKGTWIERHKPSTPGAAIYVDSTNHTAEVRGFFVDRMRTFTAAPIHCVRLRASLETCLGRCERTCSGAAQIQVQARLERIHAEFEEVRVDEPFDSIILT